MAKGGPRVEHIVNTKNGVVVEDFYYLLLGDGTYSWERLKVNKEDMKPLLEKIKEAIYAEGT